MGGPIEQGTGESKPQGVSVRRLADIESYIIISGRPLFGDTAPQSVIDQQRRRGVPFKKIACPYHDSRGDFPENMISLSSLLEMNRNSGALLDGFAWIKNHFFAGEPPQQVTVEQAITMALIARAIPSYLVLRGSDFIEEDKENKLPNVVGDLHQAAKGAIIALNPLMRELGEEQIIDSRDIYARANTPGRNGRSLLVDGDRSCAASESTILQALDALLYGKKGDPAKSELNNYIGADEFARLTNFSLTVDKISTAPSRAILVDLQRDMNIFLDRDPDNLM